jgi:hypothetical protein
MVFRDDVVQQVVAIAHPSELLVVDTEGLHGLVERVGVWENVLHALERTVDVAECGKHESPVDGLGV